MKTGRVVWTHIVGAGAETSPTVIGDAVYYGDTVGNLVSLRTSDGHANWVYHASGAIKGGPAYATATCTSATTAATPTPSTPTAVTRCGEWAPAARSSGSARATSTPPQRSRSVGCTWATPTGACTPLPNARASWPGPPAPAPTCTARRRWPRFRGWARRCTSAPTTATSTPSTPIGRCSLASLGRRQDLRLAHDHRRRRLLLQPRLQEHRRPQRPHGSEGVRFLRRCVQPGDCRSRRDLHGRLRRHLPVPAQELAADRPRRCPQGQGQAR